MAREPSLHEVIDGTITSRLRDLHTMQPGVVVSYDRATHTAEVKLGVKRTITRADGSELEEDVPPLKNVPVAMPMGGSGPTGDPYYIDFPLVAGNEGMLLFSEAAWGHFRENGQLSPPGDLRRHSLAYCAFMPCGLVNRDDYETGTPGFIIVPDERWLSVKRAGSADDWVALDGPTMDNFTALKDAINGWTPVPNDGGAALKTALSELFATWPQSVAAGTLKAGPG